MKNRCVIIGASPETDIQLVKQYVCKDDFVICADGGFAAAQKAEINPDLLIGDFDSLGYVPDAECEMITLPVKKDETDTMCCARIGLGKGFDDFLLLGMSGGRADHSYSNLCVLRFLEGSGARAVMADPDQKIRILLPGRSVISGMSGKLFSIFPFGCMDCCVSLEGFEYPLSQGHLYADNALGQSNVVISDSAVITVHSGCAVAMLTFHP